MKLFKCVQAQKFPQYDSNCLIRDQTIAWSVMSRLINSFSTFTPVTKSFPSSDIFHCIPRRGTFLLTFLVYSAKRSPSSCICSLSSAKRCSPSHYSFTPLPVNGATGVPHRPPIVQHWMPVGVGVDGCYWPPQRPPNSGLAASVVAVVVCCCYLRHRRSCNTSATYIMVQLCCCNSWLHRILLAEERSVVKKNFTNGYINNLQNGF